MGMDVDMIGTGQNMFSDADITGAFGGSPLKLMMPSDLEYPVVDSSFYIENTTNQRKMMYNLMLAISEKLAHPVKGGGLLMRFLNNNATECDHIMSRVNALNASSVTVNSAGGTTVAINQHKVARIFQHMRSKVLVKPVIVGGTTVTPAVLEGSSILTDIFVGERNSHLVRDSRIQKFFSGLKSSWDSSKNGVGFESTFNCTGDGKSFAFEFNW